MTEPRRIPLDERGMPVRKEDVSEQAHEIASDCDCPRLDPDDWDGVENDWSDISFVRTSTSAVLGVPVGFDGSREALRKKAAKAGATVPEDAMLLIGSGKFRRPILLEVEDALGGKALTARRDRLHRQLPAPWGSSEGCGTQPPGSAAKYGRERTTSGWYLTCRLCSKARELRSRSSSRTTAKGPEQRGPVELYLGRIALGLGALVGLEREVRGHEAGIARTRWSVAAAAIIGVISNELGIRALLRHRPGRGFPGRRSVSSAATWGGGLPQRRQSG